MINIKRDIEVDAPVERVYEFLSDPTNLPEIWPSMVEVTNVKGTDGGKEFDWSYKMVGVRFNGHTRMTLDEAGRRIETESEGDITSHFTYTFEDVDGKTRFINEVDYTVPGALLGKLAEPIIRRLNEREAEVFMNNLKDRVELGQEAAEAAKPEEEGPEAPPPA